MDIRIPRKFYREGYNYATPPAEERDRINVKIMRPKEVHDYLFRIYQNEKTRKQAVFIWGGFGIGKSNLIKDLSEELARNEAYKECLKEKPENICELTVCIVPSEDIIVKDKEDMHALHFKEDSRGIKFCGPLKDKEMDKVYIYYVVWNETTDDNKLYIFKETQSKESTLPKRLFILADFRLSLVGDPSQFTGPIIPELKEGVSRWFPPMLFKVLSHKDVRGVLFFDEFNQAIKQIMLSAYQLILDRQIGDISLSPGVMVVAAGNPPFEVPSASLPFPPEPLRDRFEEIYMVGNAGEWLEWAIKHNIHPVIIEYLIQKILISNSANVLYDPNQKDKLKPVTPRAWERASNILHAYNDIIEEYKKELSELIDMINKKESPSKIHAKLREIRDKYYEKLEEVSNKLSLAIGTKYSSELLLHIDPLHKVSEELLKNITGEIDVSQAIANAIYDAYELLKKEGAEYNIIPTLVELERRLSVDEMIKILKYLGEKMDKDTLLDFESKYILSLRHLMFVSPKDFIKYARPDFEELAVKLFGEEVRAEFEKLINEVYNYVYQSQ